MAKMTNREFYKAIEASESLSAELRQFATEAIAMLDKRNEAKKSATHDSRAEEYKPLMEQALEVLRAGDATGMLTSEVGEAMGITASKASSTLKRLESDGKVTSAKVKVPKVGERVKYTLAE